VKWIHESITGHPIERVMLGLYPIQGLPDVTVNSSTTFIINSGIEPPNEDEFANTSGTSEVDVIEIGKQVDPCQTFPVRKLGETISNCFFAC
jgi:hypothetical protein